MKIFNFFATSLLIALGMVFYSCNKEENIPENIFTSETVESLFFKKYGIDIQDYKYYNYNYLESNLIFNGIKDGVFLASAYDTLSYKKLCEFIDTESTPETVTKNIGYGESKELNLVGILSEGIVLTDNGYIGQVIIIYTDGDQISFHEAQMKQITFFSNGRKIEKTISFNSFDIGIEIKKGVKKWHEDSAIASDEICFNDKGDTLFMVKSPILETEVPITYTDGINIDLECQRTNHATGEIIWYSKVIPPFEIPSNAKRDIIITEQNGNIWKCEANLIFYNGTKRNFTFEINIDDGTIIGQDIKVTGITIDKDVITLKKDSTYQLVANVLPENASNKNVIWSTSNDSIATIDNTGLIHALSNGKVIITAKTEDGGFTATTNVTIKSDNIEDNVISVTNMSLISVGDIFICNIKDEILNSSEDAIQITKFIVADEYGNSIIEKSYSDNVLLGGKNYAETFTIKELYNKLNITWIYIHKEREHFYRKQISLPNNVKP